MRDIAIAAVLVVVAYLATSHRDHQMLEADHKTYCSMVLANKVNPHYGWPDYKGIYETACK